MMVCLCIRISVAFIQTYKNKEFQHFQVYNCANMHDMHVCRRRMCLLLMRIFIELLTFKFPGDWEYKHINQLKFRNFNFSATIIFLSVLIFYDLLHVT